MEIKKDTKNELLKRQELIIELEAEKNPSFDEVRKMISEEVGKPEENIDVRRVRVGFGQRRFKGEVYVYDSKEDLDKMKKLEVTRKQRKEGEKKESREKKEESSGEEKADTAPVEEKVEEEKAEQKPSEAPVEERVEEEAKAVEEEVQKEEESKEP